MCMYVHTHVRRELLFFKFKISSFSFVHAYAHGGMLVSKPIYMVCAYVCMYGRVYVPKSSGLFTCACICTYLYA